MLSPRHHTPRLPPEVASPEGPDEPGNHPDAAAARVWLADPQSARGSRLMQALAPDLPVVYESQLEALERCCREQAPAVLALPLAWSPAETGSAPAVDLALLRFIRTYGHRVAIVVYGDTGQLPISVYCQPLAAGARQILNERSPAFLEDLRQTLLRLLQDHHAQQDEYQQLSGLFAAHGLYGRSPALRTVFRRAMKASHFDDLPVLIVGETGTGKQRLAEAIHALDPRRCDKPLLTLNCSALHKSLAESELFGHAKGAFSGASAERRGLLRAAEGGTLLLDEVGELDLELQPKLLRVLQERRLLPVGEDYEHPIDVRIIAVTNRPLEEMIAAGKFREDLYQRLNVFRVRIPPLRERPEDVEAQARHFLRRYQGTRTQPVTGFGPRVLEALCGLPWQGNTRQLENLVREVLAHKDQGTVVEMEDLPRWILETLAQAEPASEPGPWPAPAERSCQPMMSLNAAVEEYERRLLESVLKQNGGNRTRTAAELGLTPRSVFNKLKKYQLG
jgi:transcriptional regulator with PAS, ATPase and Fis domain